MSRNHWWRDDQWHRERRQRCWDALSEDTRARQVDLPPTVVVWSEKMVEILDRTTRDPLIRLRWRDADGKET